MIIKLEKLAYGKLWKIDFDCGRNRVQTVYSPPKRNALSICDTHLNQFEQFVNVSVNFNQVYETQLVNFV